MLNSIITKAGLLVLICCMSALHKWHNFSSEHTMQADFKPSQTKNDYSFYLKNHSFAGEKMPINKLENRKKYKKALNFYTRHHHSLKMMKQKAEYWLPVFKRIIKKHDLPEDFKYIPIVESNLRQVKSDKGAAGFWQITKPTAKNLGMEINKQIDERYDPVKSAHAACKYFKRAYLTFGNWTDVAVSYNMGIGGLQQHLHLQKGDNFYDLKFKSKEISTYIFRLMAIKEIFENPVKYNLSPFKPAKMHYRKVKIDNNISDLKKFALQHEVSYHTFKDYNGWIRNNSFIIDSLKHEQYYVKLPYNDPRYTKRDLKEKQLLKSISHNTKQVSNKE